MKRLFLALLLLSLMPLSANALTDAEYRRYMRQSSAFAQAENDLGVVWKELRNTLSSNAFRELQDDQRRWLDWRNSREASAADHAQTTEDRVHKLKRMLNKYNGAVATEQGSVSGYPAWTFFNGRHIYSLLDRRGKQIALIGEMEDFNSYVLDCLDQGAQGRYEVTVDGTLSRMKDGSLSFAKGRMACRRK